jgi:hypothetical protein
MVDLPDWTINLRPLYACLRAYKRNKTLRRSYYRKIEKEKLRLAEEGVNQEKIRLACRFLASFSCVRNYQCDACRRMLNDIVSPERQFQINFTN